MLIMKTSFYGLSVVSGAGIACRVRLLTLTWLLAASVATGIVGTRGAVYEVGPGQTRTNLASVPWTNLGPGDIVNIHATPGGYHEIVLLSNSGASNAPITLRGVPDPSTGALPIIDGANAVSSPTNPWRNPIFNNFGVVVVSRAQGTSYGYVPSWITLENLHIQNAYVTNKFTTSTGTLTNYDGFACCVYVEFAQHFTIRGCELNGSNNGFFCNSKNGTLSETSGDILVERSWIHDNGTPGNYGVHNMYTEALGITVQHNLIGPLRAGADGEQWKDRSAGTRIRYNQFIMGPGPGTCMWIESPQGGQGVLDVDPTYHTNYCYGNVIYNPPNSSGIVMVRYDALGVEGQPRNGTLYFYNNTIVNHANQAQRYGTYLFELPHHDEVLATGIHDTLDCRNNIIANVPSTVGGTPSNLSLLISDDSTINYGPNWVSPGAQLYSLPYQKPAFFGTITGTNNLIFGDTQGHNTPGFVDVTTTNFHLLSTSRSIDKAGPQAIAVAGTINDVALEYVYPTGFQTRVTSGAAPDLGAFEGNSTNTLPTMYALTVVAGAGGGNYAAGAIVPIAADAAPAGQTFDRWTGATVADANAASTFLTMPAANATVTATYKTVAVANYTLTVTHGTGGGSYQAGATVTISADAPPSGQVFDKWTGGTVASATSASTTVTMPAANVTLTATYKSSTGSPSAIPQPVASHPRLWITTNDLPHLRAWAVASNPVYQALRMVLTEANNNYTTQFYPKGVANPNWPDFGDTQGYTGLLSEEHAFIFAFFSLIDPDPVQRGVYADRAANLIRVMMSEAAKGSSPNQPFRDRMFATYNRANASLASLPLAVDWIYNATGTNGQPVLSPSDKLAIRNGFLVWANECLHASTAGGDAPVLGVVNNPAALLPNNSAYRMAANNYYLGHARMLTLMSLAVDPSDDPAIDSALPDSAPTNSLRAYISNLTGAWLYQEYAIFGDGLQVAQDYGLPGSGSGFGQCSGGMPPEGMLYGHSFGFLLGQLLALQTAGYNDISLSGPQCHLIGAPIWDRFCDAWLTALTPAPVRIESYMEPTYQMMGYGDMLRLYVTPDNMQMAALLTLLDEKTGVTHRANKTRWFAIEVPEGGAANLTQRVARPWDWQESVLYYLLMDPGLATPPDPRPSLPTLFYDAPQGNLVAHSDWTTNQSEFHWRCSWNSINHQNADAGMFQFLRKGEFLTKEYSGYDNAGLGQSSLCHNTLSLQNLCPNGVPNNLQWYEQFFWTTGSQFILGSNGGDPTSLVGSGPGYVSTYGDLTPLYNRPNFWTPADASLEILHASRSIVWLKPDHIVVYDRATSKDAGLFKRFNLTLPTAPTIAPRAGGGSFLTETLPDGQRLFINSVLPLDGRAQVAPLANTISAVAEGESCHYRLTIEDTNNPANIRFLHVLQGADAGVNADPVAVVQSLSGTSFEGVAVRDALVLFPVNAIGNASFNSVTYPAIGGATNHYIAGLAPGAGYAVTISTNSGLIQITVAAGGNEYHADGAGVLAFTPGVAAPVQSFNLIVHGGSGSGLIQAGNTVTITADPAPAGKVFDFWTGTPVSNPQASSTTLIMPASDTTVTATYKDGGSNPGTANHQPIAHSQSVPVTQDTPQAITLSGHDVDGDPLTYTITQQPTKGRLSGAPPNLVFTPNTGIRGPDWFFFTVNDGKATSVPAIVQLGMNTATNPGPAVTILSPADRSWYIGPSDVTFTANATDPNGIRNVDFFSGATRLGGTTNAPYTFTWTNAPLGDHVVFAKAFDTMEARTFSTPVTISILPVAPVLTLKPAVGGQWILSWPGALQDFQLETASTPNGPWTLLNQPVVDSASEHTVTLSPSTPAFSYFRLEHQR